MPPKRLENLLNPNDNGELGEIIRHAQDMGELVQILQAVLPAGDREAIVAANLRENGQLVVLTSTSAWAAKLRFEADALLDATRQAGLQVQDCKIRVRRD